MVDWQGWPADQRIYRQRSQWLIKHLDFAITIGLTFGAVLFFICGIAAGVIQPSIYKTITSWLGL